METDQIKQIFTKFCNPEFYPRQEDISSELHNGFSQEVLLELKDIIDNQILTPENDILFIEQYFNICKPNKERARQFLIMIGKQIETALRL